MECGVRLFRQSGKVRGMFGFAALCAATYLYRAGALKSSTPLFTLSFHCHFECVSAKIENGQPQCTSISAVAQGKKVAVSLEGFHFVFSPVKPHF